MDNYRDLALAIIRQACKDARDDISARAWLFDESEDWLATVHAAVSISYYREWVLRGCPQVKHGANNANDSR